MRKIISTNLVVIKFAFVAGGHYAVGNPSNRFDR
jgi:hypothetical protein